MFVQVLIQLGNQAKLSSLEARISPLRPFKLRLGNVHLGQEDLFTMQWEMEDIGPRSAFFQSSEMSLNYTHFLYLAAGAGKGMERR